MVFAPAIGAGLCAPGAGFLRPMVFSLARHIPLALAKRMWALRTLRPRYFCVVSHHFMNAAELATDRGRERLANCVFRVPVNGRLEPMCAVNALGIREQVYAQNRRSTGTAAATARAAIGHHPWPTRQFRGS